MKSLRYIGLCLLLALGWSTFANAADTLDPQTEKLIEQKVEQKWQEYINSDAFDKRVKQSIIKFIDEQNQARADKERKAREAMVKNVAPVDPAVDHIRGPKDAAYTLIEYSDFECPFCKRFYATANQFFAKHPEVSQVYRHFPLSFHNPGAQKEAEASECAAELGGNKAFWEFHDRIFERTRSNGKGFPIANLQPLAEEIGLDGQAFKKCFDSGKYKGKVQANEANGQASGVSGTPTSFLRDNSTGKIIAITGAQPLPALEQALERLKQQSN